MVQRRRDHQPIHPLPDPDAEGQPELLRGIWQAPRGPLTRMVAWLILAMIALAVVVMLWVIIRM